MGRSGPLPMPENVRQLRGNPGQRKPAPHVKAIAAIPVPPKGLSREASEEWKRITPELHRLHLLAMIDRAILILYCKTWARWVELDKLLDKEGTTVRDRGISRKHPAWQQWRECGLMVAAFAKELGTSPNARLRMTLPKQEQDDGAGLD